MITHGVQQGTEEWFALRAGIPTASEFDSLITPKWEARSGQGVDTYLAKKLAERWTGRPLQSFSGGSLEQGSIREEEAIPYYELTTGQTINRVGFVTTDDGRTGCSPDGMLDDGTGIEIKSPEPHTHVGYLLAGVVPKDYLAQVHGSMAVTGAKSWKFMSYCRDFPPLLLTIERDEKIVESILDAVSKFNERLEAAYARIASMTSGVS